MTTEAYWKNRAKQVEQAANNQSVKYIRQAEKKYQAAMKDIDAKINKWYGRIASNNNVSMTEARRLLSKSELTEFQWSVKQYMDYGRENAIDQMWMKELENASAKFHINRLEAMKMDCRQSMEEVFGGGQQTMYDTLRTVYSDSFYRTCFDVQKGAGVAFDVGRIDKRQMEKLIHKPWSADGQNFSDRLWKNKTQLINRLDQELNKMVLTGSTPEKAIKSIQKALETSKSNAARLVLTEQAFFTTKAQNDAFNELGVEEFEFVATLDGVTCSECGALDGQHFPLKDQVVGVNAPPIHPYCRCTTVPFFDDEFADGERWSRDHENVGEKEKYRDLYKLPDEATFKDWKDAFVDGGSKDNLIPLNLQFFGKKYNPLPENSVVNTLRKESKPWIDSLTEKEKYAINKYTHNSGDEKPDRFFERLNAMLRGDIPEDSVLMEYSDTISTALQKNTLQHDIVLYRSMDINPYKDLEVGQVFNIDSFVSASVTKSGALNGDVQMIIHAPAGTNGAYIEQLSQFPKQREFLIDKGVEVRIESNQENIVELWVIV